MRPAENPDVNKKDGESGMHHDRTSGPGGPPGSAPLFRLTRTTDNLTKKNIFDHKKKGLMIR